MARELTPAELDELLAAYALDAVDAEEREQLDAYLERSPDAAREIAELQETAALLAFTGPDDAPDTLWDRIENALGAEPPRLVMPFDTAARPSPRRRRGVATKVAIGIAGASAIAAGITAVVVSDEMSRQEERLDRVAGSVASDGMHRAAEAAAADPPIADRPARRTAWERERNRHRDARWCCVPHGARHGAPGPGPHVPAVGDHR